MQRSSFFFAIGGLFVLASHSSPALACSDNDVENLLAQCVANAQPTSETQIISQIWIKKMVDALQTDNDKEVMKGLKGCVRNDVWYDEVVDACGEGGTIDYMRKQFGLATD